MPLPLESVPNFSEGRDEATIAALRDAVEPRARLLDVHADADHNRSVFTLVGEDSALVDALVAGVACALERIDLRRHDGLHPRVGALDVMPVVYLDEEQRGAACAEVLAAAGRIGAELEVPVVLYGELATSPAHAERAHLRCGGWRALAQRIESGEVRPDFGPSRAHPTAGAILAAARPPLIAFNVDLATADVDEARRVAGEIREAQGGLPGVRAMGLYLEDRGRAQVSTNVHDYRLTPLRAVVEAVRGRPEIVEAELVGLAPEGAFERFPGDVPIRGFSPERHLLENALRSLQ